MTRRSPEERLRIVRLMVQDGEPDYQAWAKQLDENPVTLRSWVHRARKRGEVPPGPVEPNRNRKRATSNATRSTSAPAVSDDPGERPLPEGLTPRQYRAMLLRLRGWTGRRIAEDVGVCEDTLCDWEKRPAWKLAWDVEVRAAHARTRAELDASAPVAARTLHEIAGGEDCPAGARVQAATAILDRVGFPKAERVEHTGPEGGPVVIEGRPLNEFSTEALLAEVARLTAASREPAEGG